MTERAVGFLRHAREIAFRDGIADEGLDDLDRDFGIGSSGKTGDGRGAQSRPGFGYIKTAVAGEARQRYVNEIERRGFTPCRNVAQGLSFGFAE